MPSFLHKTIGEKKTKKKKSTQPCVAAINSLFNCVTFVTSADTATEQDTQTTPGCSKRGEREGKKERKKGQEEERKGKKRKRANSHVRSEIIFSSVQFNDFFRLKQCKSE